MCFTLSYIYTLYIKRRARVVIVAHVNFGTGGLCGFESLYVMTFSDFCCETVRRNVATIITHESMDCGNVHHPMFDAAM